MFLLMAFLLSTNVSAQQPKADLDQAKNGGNSGPNPISPINWVNGNLGSSNSHYREGYSVPYRSVMTNLPLGNPITIIIGFDIKHSNRNAIDYLTYFRRNEPHTGWLPEHGEEDVNPILGVAGTLTPGTGFTIPSPTVNASYLPPTTNPQPTTSYTNLPNIIDVDGVTPGDQTPPPGTQRKMAIWNGNITAIAYVSVAFEGDLNAAQSEARIRVTFIPLSSTVVLAWGGHIGSRSDWGFDGTNTPRSAGGISGSPYHMRLISWGINATGLQDGSLPNLGNTDRSLSAASVAAPPTCNDITISGGDSPVCPGTQIIHTATLAANVCTQPAYSWAITPGTNTSGASISGSTTSSSVTVNVGNTCGSYQICVTIICTEGTVTCCKTVLVQDITPPSVTCPSAATVACTALLPAPFTTIANFITGGGTVLDNCTATNSLTISHSNGAITGDINCEYSFVRTYTITDQCGNSSTCTQTLTVERLPFNNPTDGSSTVSCPALAVQPTPPVVNDNCGAPIQPSGPTIGGTLTTCEGTKTYTWLYTDCEGNTQDWVYTYTIEREDFTMPQDDGSTVTCIDLATEPTPPAVNDNCGDAIIPTGPVVGGNNTSCGGTKTYTWTYTDCEGNSHDWVYTYVINDNIDPVITSCPQNITAGECNTVTFTATATDNCDPNPTVTYSHQSGSTFPVGTTTVTVTATDACGNSSTCTFDVTIVAKPTCSLTAPNPLPNCGATGNTLSATTATGSGLTYAWSVSGTGWVITSATNIPTITYTAGSSGSSGTFNLTVTDAYGCSSTCTVTFECFAGQGCSPGFWKNHPELWNQFTDPVVVNMPAGLKFITTTNFFTYFAMGNNSCLEMPGNLTMLGALNLNGGGCRAFARHAVSALLTSASGLNMPYPAGTTDFTSLYNAIRTAFINCNCSGTLFHELEYISSLDGPWCSALQNLLLPSNNLIVRGSEANAVTTTRNGVSVTAYPNPFDDNIRFSIQSDISGAAILEVYNILGVKIQTIYKGFVFAGKGQTIEYQVPNIYRTNLIYKLRVGDKTVTGKLINVK